MKFQYGLSQLVWAISLMPLLALPAWAEQLLIAGETGNQATVEGVGIETEASEAIETVTAEPQSALAESSRSGAVRSDAIEGAALTVEQWMAQIAQSLTQVTGVQVHPTETGLSVILQTAEGTLAVPSPSVVGSAAEMHLITASAAGTQRLHSIFLSQSMVLHGSPIRTNSLSKPPTPQVSTCKIR